MACFDVTVDDVDERNAGAEMLTSYGKGYHRRMRQEEEGAGGEARGWDDRGSEGGGRDRCVDEALWQAKGRGQGGRATEAHFVEMRRQALEVDRGDGKWLRETGPVPAGLVGRYGSAMGIWVVVVRETAGTATIRWGGNDGGGDPEDELLHACALAHERGWSASRLNLLSSMSLPAAPASPPVRNRRGFRGVQVHG